MDALSLPVAFLVMLAHIPLLFRGCSFTSRRPDLRVLPFFAITRYGVKRVTEVAHVLLICGGRVLPGTSSQAP